LSIETLDEEDKVDLEKHLKKYHTTKSDSIKLKALFSLTFLRNVNVWRKYNDFLLSDIRRLFNSSKRTVGDRYLNKIYGRALYNISYYYAELNNEDSCYKYANQAIKYFKISNDGQGLIDAYNAIGNSLHKRGKIEESIKYYQLSQSTAESINDKGGIAFSYLSVAHVYRGIDEFEKAIEKYKVALKLFEELKDGESIADTWNYLGVVYKWSKDTIQSQNAYKKSLELSQEMNYTYGIATAKLNIGIHLQDKAKYKEAIRYYEESLQGFKEVGSPNGISYCLNNLALSFSSLGQDQKALLFSKQSLELSLQMGYPESILTSSDVVQKTYRKLGKYKEAVDAMDVYYKMKDSIQNVETQKKALKAQLDYENEKKVLELNRIQESKNILAEEDRKRSKIIVWSVIAGLVLLSVFLVLIYRSLQKNKQANKVISMQKHMVEEKQKEILDSIRYARRIQQSLLPTEKYIEKNVNMLKDKKSV
jgi:tetratricopeptide (TPR) repeat protein